MEIRTVTEADAPELCEYASSLFGENLPGIFKRPSPTLEQELDYIRTHLESANSTLLVAVHDDTVVGLAGLMGESNEEERHVASLAISVARGFRGRGVGTALIDALMSWAPSAGITRVQLWAWANNPRAISLYESVGFEREGIARHAIISDGHPVDAVLMARLLAV